MEEIKRLVSEMSNDELVAEYRRVVQDYPPEALGVHLPHQIGTLLDADVLAQRPFLEMTLILAHAFRAPLQAPELSCEEMARVSAAIGKLAVGPMHPDGLAAACRKQIKKLT